MFEVMWIFECDVCFEIEFILLLVVGVDYFHDVILVLVGMNRCNKGGEGRKCFCYLILNIFAFLQECNLAHFAHLRRTVWMVDDRSDE